MSELPPDDHMFGIPPDKDGNIRFLTLESETPVRSHEESLEMFQALGEMALQNPGYLPILRLHYERP